MHLRLAAMMLSALALSGCFQDTLDYRNAEISSGKVFVKGENKPFSGIVTNVPVEDLPRDSFAHMIVFAKFVLGKEAPDVYPNIRSFCDSKVKDGVLEGNTTCPYPNSDALALTLPFERGTINGKVTLHNPSDKGKALAEGEFKNGLLEGDIKVYWPASGKVVGQLPMKNGKREGTEEVFFASTGKTALIRNWHADNQDGLMLVYTEDGKLNQAVYMFGTFSIETVLATSQSPILSGDNCIEEWRIGFQAFKRNADPNARQTDWTFLCNAGLVPRLSDLYINVRHSQFRGIGPYGNNTYIRNNDSDCVGKWISAYRQENGADALVRTPQLEEWESWCKEGKRP